MLPLCRQDHSISDGRKTSGQDNDDEEGLYLRHPVGQDITSNTGSSLNRPPVADYANYLFHVNDADAVTAF